MLSGKEKNALIGFLVGYLIIDWVGAFLMHKTDPKAFNSFFNNLTDKKYIIVFAVAIIIGFIVYRELNKTSEEQFNIY